MVSAVIKAVAIFGVFLFAKPTIDGFYPVFRFLGYLLGIGWPMAVVGDPIGEHIYHYIRTRIIENSTKRMILGAINRMSSPEEYQNPYKKKETVSSQGTYQEKPSLLTPAQIEQLSVLRSRVNIAEVRNFPKISIEGNQFSNLVPSAGIFTALIKRKNPDGEFLNLVVMLANSQAVSDFENRLKLTDRRNYWAQGYLLPSRDGTNYSILYVTALDLCGIPISFLGGNNG